jgi:type II secretory pathway component PulF
LLHELDLYSRNNLRILCLALNTEFKYRARDPEGKAITGLLEGDDKASVAEQIQRLGYIPVEIELEQKEKE